MGDSRHTVLLDSVEEMRHDAGNNVMALRHGPGPRLIVEPGVLLEVARREAVLSAAEPLRPERPVEPPRPQPVSLGGPVGPPHDEQGEEPLEKAPRRWRSCCSCYDDVVHPFLSGDMRPSGCGNHKSDPQLHSEEDDQRARYK